MSSENYRLLFRSAYFVHPEKVSIIFRYLKSYLPAKFHNITDSLFLDYFNAVNVILTKENLVQIKQDNQNNLSYYCFDTNLKTNQSQRILGLAFLKPDKDKPYFLGFYPENHHLIKEKTLSPLSLCQFENGKHLLDNFNELTFKNISMENFPLHAFKRVIDPIRTVTKGVATWQEPNERYLEEYSRMEEEQFLTLINDGINCVKKGIEKPIYGIFENKPCLFIKISFPLSNQKEYEGYLAFSEDKKNELTLHTYLSKNMVKGWALFNDLNNVKEFSAEKIQENEQNKLDSLEELKKDDGPEL